MDVVLGSKRQGSRIRPDPGNDDKTIRTSLQSQNGLERHIKINITDTYVAQPLRKPHNHY